jgi:hypothetical protein
MHYSVDDAARNANHNVPITRALLSCLTNPFGGPNHSPISMRAGQEIILGTDMQLVDPRHPDYHSFMLRVWRASASDPWRGSLRSTATDQSCHFDTLDALFTCLVEQLTEGGPTDVASNVDGRYVQDADRYPQADDLTSACG